jgi:hypothetical protein
MGARGPAGRPGIGGFDVPEESGFEEEVRRRKPPKKKKNVGQSRYEDGATPSAAAAKKDRRESGRSWRDYDDGGDDVGEPEED